MRFFLVSVCLLAFSGSSFAAMDHEGYLDTVAKERQTVSRALRVIENPEPQQKPLQQKIFTSKLTREFRTRYREKFGQTVAEQQNHLPNQYSYYNSPAQANIEHFQSGTFRGDHEEWHSENQRFGSFMFRRLAEYHVDQWIKDKPTVQKMYEFKEKYSRMHLSLGPSFKLKARYMISSNTVRVKIVNPWVTNSWLLEMDSAALGPSRVTESTISLGFRLPARWSLLAQYRALESSMALTTHRRFAGGVSASLTNHWNRRLGGSASDLDGPRENLILGGLNWTY